MNTLSRAARALAVEFGVDPRKAVGFALSRALPQHGFNRTRTALLRALGIRIGAKSAVAGAFNVTGSGSTQELLTIGGGCYITGPLHIDLGASVRIGARVYVGYDVSLLTLDHEIGRPEQRCGRLLSGPIEIGDGAWLGSRATILPGVRVGAGAIVGAGAVVVKDVPDNVMVAGVPAKVVRDLGEEEAPMSSRQVRLSVAGLRHHG